MPLATSGPVAKTFYSNKSYVAVNTIYHPKELGGLSSNEDLPAQFFLWHSLTMFLTAAILSNSSKAKYGSLHIGGGF